MLAFLQKYKIALIAGAAITAALVIAFIAGGNGSTSGSATVDTAATAAVTAAPDAAVTDAPTTASASLEATTAAAVSTQAETTAVHLTSVPSATAALPPTTAAAISTEEPTEATTGKYRTDPIPTGKPAPVEPEEQTTVDNTLRCTLSISCATVWDNLDQLDEELVEIIPADGWLLKPEQFEFTQGESVFDLLVRICKDKKIHLDHSFTPAYNSAYIKGIGNLYEFDCGDQSGWIYAVNGWIPNYGCSRYVLQNGDTVAFRYTCQLGRDVGWRE